MSGRGEEPVIEYTLAMPETEVKTFVRARLVKTRPVPETCQEPDSFMTHQIEYIVGGGSSLEWVKLDEAKQTVQQRSGWIPALAAAGGRGDDEDEEGGEPPPPPCCWPAVPYRVLERRAAAEPSPGQYGATPLSVTRPQTSSSTMVLGRRSERWSTTHERRPRMPEPATYSPSCVRTTKSSPSFGFGSAPRMPVVRREQGPEPGAYELRNCWDGANHAFGKGKRKKENFASEPGLEPIGYDALRGLRLTQPKEPAWRLNTRGGRSPVAAMRLPAKVGPGSYDAIEVELVKERSPAAQYFRRKGLSRRPLEVPPDPPFGHFTLFAN